MKREKKSHPVPTPIPTKIKAMMVTTKTKRNSYLSFPAYSNSIAHLSFKKCVYFSHTSIPLQVWDDILSYWSCN